MPRYRARVELRRLATDARWVIAGVTIAGRFWPARPGVEPIHGRLPAPGLVGWADLDTPIVAPDLAAAAVTALELAARRWPERVSRTVPWSAGEGRGPRTPRR